MPKSRKSKSGESPTIVLEKEINFIKNYVALQQVRKEESLIVNLTIDENVKGFTIAPLLFIAFIENAFKHVGNNDQKENKINIVFEKEENSLIFQSFNTKELNTCNNSIEHKGIGIANVKRRLRLLYPQKHDLVIEENEHFYKVNLKLQII